MITGDNTRGRPHRRRGRSRPVLIAHGKRSGDAFRPGSRDDRTRHGDLREIEPAQKQRLVRALRAGDHVIGYLGDGINDAPALHAADVGISVDTAVDVAKQAAAIVLLDKNLAVVADGVRLGRQTFANTLKYINVTTSANFGNMLSMAAAAVFLPFLPLLPSQILLLNFLSDIPAMTIARDRVDPELLARPVGLERAGDPHIHAHLRVDQLGLRRRHVRYAPRACGFDAGPESCSVSGWFVVSTMTELAVMLACARAGPSIRVGRDRRCSSARPELLS